MAMLCLALLCALTTPATAQPTPATVRSTAIDATSVTIYRAPRRGVDETMDLGNLQGFALISETRTVTLPAGPATIRFEGVADGMVPVSAVVTGLPGGVIQKNRDAAILSPASLLDGSLGRSVSIRRTNRRTGAVVEQDAVIRTGSNGAVVFQTAEGLEALRCSGLPETIAYHSLPDGLTDRPVLSVDTVSTSATTVTVTLTYLASGFDWQANYVGNIHPNEDRLDLFGWMTLANGNGGDFTDATLLTIAGELNIEGDYADMAEAPPSPELRLTCYPLDGTSTIAIAPPPPPLPTPGLRNQDGSLEDSMEIVVTAQRRSESLLSVPLSITAVTASQETLGALHLFRVPFRTTVAAHAQKQVGFLSRNNIPFERVHVAHADDGQDEPQSMTLWFRLHNRARDGLGTPLPNGEVALFGQSSVGTLLVANAPIPNRAVDEEVEIAIAPAPLVTITASDSIASDARREEQYFTVTNNSPAAINAEVYLGNFEEEDWQVARANRHHIRLIHGQRTWAIRVPARGSARLTLREIIR